MSDTQSNDRVLLDIDQGIATLTLNNAARRNGMDIAMARALKARLDQIHGMADQLKGVLLCAAGDHFNVGGDIRYFEALLEQPDQAPAGFGDLVDAFNNAVRVIHALPCPVIAFVQGAAAGGGLSLALACDMIIATDDAQFLMAYGGLGATPDGGGSWSLTRYVGLPKALHMFLFNEPVNAARALELGLVVQVVPRTELDATRQQMATRLAAGSRASLQAGKALMRTGMNNDLDTALDNEKKYFVDLAGQDDFQEGVSAFIQKRVPAFKP